MPRRPPPSATTRLAPLAASTLSSSTIHCDLTYGEVLARSIAAVVYPALGLSAQGEGEEPQQQPQQGAAGAVFYDIGSGTAKIPLQVAYQCWSSSGGGGGGGSVRRSVGVELQGPGRHDVAAAAFARLATVSAAEVEAQLRDYVTRGPADPSAAAAAAASVSASTPPGSPGRRRAGAGGERAAAATLTAAQAREIGALAAAIVGRLRAIAPHVAAVQVSFDDGRGG